VGGHGTLQNQTEAKTGLDYATLAAGVVNNLGTTEESGGVISGGLPGGHGRAENASQALQSLYVAMAVFDVVSMGKALYSLGKALWEHTVETIAGRLAGDRALREGLRELTEREAANFATRIGSKGDAQILQQAAKLAGKNASFMDNLAALEKVVTAVNPTNQIWKLGEYAGKPVFGRVATRVGIVEIDGITQVVRLAPGAHELEVVEILGPLHSK
jgi:hypothetical protein